MLISVIMAVRNGLPHLEEALASIRAQKEVSLEFIIVDDGSTDGSDSILRRHAAADPRIRLIEQSNAGLTRSLNAALRLARGEFVARMDADDIAEPDRLARQAAWLDSHPAVVALGAQALGIDPDGRPIGPWNVPLTHAEIDGAHIAGHPGRIIHPLAMMRREAVLRAGAYDERHRVAQDFDLWLRLAEIGELANLPDILLRYRHHFGSASTARRAEQIATVHAITREARARRRLPALASQPFGGGLPTAREEIRADWARQAVFNGHWRTAMAHAVALGCAPGHRATALRIAAAACRCAIRARMPTLLADAVRSLGRRNVPKTVIDRH